MRNGMAFPNPLIFGRGLKICIAISLCCYIALLGIIELTHDHTKHSHDHTEHPRSENTCLACFYNSQHLGVEIESSALDSPFFFFTGLQLDEDTFLPLELTIHTRSRAPPVFSTELTSFAAS